MTFASTRRTARRPLGLAAFVLATAMLSPAMAQIVAPATGAAASSAAAPPAVPSSPITPEQPAPHPRLRIWDLKIGSTIAQMPAWIEFKSYACGSNGGPPLKALSGWGDFAKCAAEPDGLHEVYFEYDDEGEYIARAHEDIRLGRDIGTVDKSFPIVASALFNDAGVLKGIRLQTDPRIDNEPDNEFVDLHQRGEHYLMGASLASQFQINATTDCKSLPLEPKESTISGKYIKLDCERTDTSAGLRYKISTRYYRKAGQAARDPHTGALTEGQFESLTRAEIYAADVPEEADAV